jgi:hypothetical protein
MKGLVAVCLAALVACPVHAAAAGEAGSPRVIERGDRVCLQRLAAGGEVLEDCRDRVVAPVAPPADDEAEADDEGGPDPEDRDEPDPEDRAVPAAPSRDEPAWIADYRASLPKRLRPPGRPADVARAQAAQDTDGGSYLVGGIAAGCLLGVAGCGGAAILGMTSDPTPPDLGHWDDAAEETEYRRVYRDEVRGLQTRNALIGGAIGTVLLVGVGVLLANEWMNEHPMLGSI